jgi:hypothetical protein
MRYAWMLALAACGSRPPATHLFPPGQGECADPKGCEAPMEPEAKFVPPDSEHGVPPVQLAPAGKIENATCAQVGVAMSSLTVGNYAEDSERAPVVAKYEAQCRKSSLDLATRTCLVEAPDQRSMAYCAPQLLPQFPIQLVDREDCTAIMVDIKNRVAELNTPSQPNWARRIAALDASCKQDRWTLELAQCARTTAMPVYPDSCMYYAPRALQQKIADRFAAADKAPNKR